MLLLLTRFGRRFGSGNRVGFWRRLGSTHTGGLWRCEGEKGKGSDWFVGLQFFNILSSLHDYLLGAIDEESDGGAMTSLVDVGAIVGTALSVIDMGADAGATVDIATGVVLGAGVVTETEAGLSVRDALPEQVGSEDGLSLEMSKGAMALTANPE
jgi:hypothetical protein